MKTFITILITALLAWAASYATSYWWMIAAVPFLVAVIAKMKSGKGFVVGSLSIALLWLYLIMEADTANNHILVSRMTTLFNLPSNTVFIIVNIFIGALIGGLGGWSGAAMNKLFKQK